ncbi:tRNA uracil 4-sulfurtransferase ThiI [Ructibacterium gallinarum]|uniref:Probable tRNA sulfurtransferase n=1 Tax=Ructibacterium gallinarum TaxID=2779355 RepID=A0A9D5M3N5_9FIRM|nr:tRNA uracil 4-sulfurtransferase ThiI [Ructibacterium gallinarum]MBE5040025.1 tRNA 4-thiouridine(8) synthase ThiI [Ructibacterium gallinarum]
MKKADIVLLKYGEIALKGLNRPMFEQQLLRNLSKALSPAGRFHIQKSQSTIYVEPMDDTIDMEDAIDRMRKVFGIVNICPAVSCEKDMDSIAQTTIACLKSMDTQGKSFKVEAKREDKQFPLNSPQICQQMGGVILKNVDGLHVDVHNPDILVQIEIRKKAYIFTEKYSGAGGMPIGTNGKAALLLSGGIDSPVAGWMIAKRGVAIDAVHFHSHPYTSDRAKEKVIDLARILSVYTGKINLHIVPFTEIQLAIIDKCPRNYLTLIMRRIMMQIAERIAVNSKAAALITGESIGQVASQTMASLAVTDNAVSMPVFRPCIGMDKEEIVQISKKIDTYETSILPYEDCCTIFVPKHPKTHPDLKEILEAEKALDNLEEMIQKAIDGEEVVYIKP